MRKVAWKGGLESSSRKDSNEVSMLIWTNFDRGAITYLNISSLPQKSHFPIEVALDSLQTQKGLELVFRPQFCNMT